MGILYVIDLSMWFLYNFVIFIIVTFINLYRHGFLDKPHR